MAVSAFKTRHRHLTAAAALAALAGIAFAPQTASAACVAADEFAGIRLPAACLTPQEGRVIRLRVFRADMAVAALSCQQQAHYNSMVTRHQDELVHEGRALRAIFQRIYRAGAERELNRFITHLANKASLKRLNIPDYCQVMDRVFRKVHAQPRQGLQAYLQGEPAQPKMKIATVRAVDTRTLATMDTAAGKPAKIVLDE